MLLFTTLFYYLLLLTIMGAIWNHQCDIEELIANRTTEQVVDGLQADMKKETKTKLYL